MSRNVPPHSCRIRDHVRNTTCESGHGEEGLLSQLPLASALLVVVISLFNTIDKIFFV